jgi:ActR/RegA family two-component response regulator
MADSGRDPRDRSALVVSDHAPTIRAAEQALGAVGYATDVARDTDPAVGDDPADYRVAIIDLDIAPETDAVELISQLVASCPETTVVAVAGKDARARLLRAIKHPRVAHALPKQSSTAHCTPDEQNLFVALRRQAAGHAPPLPLSVNPYLAQITRVVEASILRSEEREPVVADIVAFAEQMHLHAEKVRRIEVLAEELILNALYDAPIDAGGKRRYAGTARSTAVVLGPDETVLVRYGCDGRNFAISVTDSFGTLEQEVVIQHLDKLVQPGGVRTIRGPGGAGIGLVMAFNCANQLIFTVSPGKFTEVLAIVDVVGSNRASQERGTAVHFFGGPARTRLPVVG